METNEALRLALKYYQSGDLTQAESLLRKVLRDKPDSPEILHFLGILNSQLENHDLALEFLIKSLQYNTANADTYLALGNIYMIKGKFEESVEYFKEVLRLNPNLVEVYDYLANILLNQKQFDEAIAYCQKALQINPKHANSYLGLGIVLQQKGELDEAIVCYQKALQINPQISEAYNNIGVIFQEKVKLNDAISYYQKALQCNPYFLDVYLNMGKALYYQGKKEEAIAAYDTAILIKPNFIKAKFARCMSQLLIVYPNQSSIEISRNQYHKELIKLRETISFETPEDIEANESAVGTSQPFFLAYQGFNDRELQKIYGELISEIMTSRYPAFADRPAMPSYWRGGSLRVGVVSGFFHSHSNWKIPIKGWVKTLHKQKFSLYGYYTGRIKDDVTEDAKQCFYRFVEDIYLFEDLCEIIRNDNLHVLIYPGINLDAMTIKLAALRLAPVQCASWGHPDTTGLPTIDYYLSSDLMELPDADDYYTEHLIRLPNLSIYYEPLDIPIISVSRNTFGIREKSIAYLCLQNLSKYLPQYDEVYPRIARQVGDCQFIFSAFDGSQEITEAFRMRIKQVFHQFDLNADEYLVFLPILDIRYYLALNRLGEIYLDSIGWSGCNSTLEAISCNLPIVTLPGNFMRGRHSAAILTMMNMQETIASSIDEYVEIAIRLGTDSLWRKQISNKIAANKQLLYKDKTCITALEAFLEKVVEEGTG
jgi:protein O-GlcNAc transferase